MLGLGSNISKLPTSGATIVTDNLVLRHGYALNPVQPLSDGAADINADAAANEYIDVGTIPITTNDVTMCAWVYVTNWVSYAGVVSNRGLGSGDPGVQIRHDNGTQKFELIIDDGVDSSRSTAGDLKNSNQWYHVCGVWDRSGSQYLYVDGILEASYAITDEAGSLTHSTNVFIGKEAGTNEMGGYICNVGYWDRVLTQAEVKSIMNKNYAGLSDREKTSLVSWWNLDSVIDSADLSVGDTTVYDNHYGGGNELGSEIVADGGFDTDVAESTSGTYWITEAGWTISGGSATYDGGGDSNTQLETITNSSFTDSKVHKLTFDFTDTGGGGVYARVCGGGFSSKITGTGFKTVYLLAGTSTNRLTFETGDDNQAFSIDNVSVKLVNGNIGTLS